MEEASRSTRGFTNTANQELTLWHRTSAKARLGKPLLISTVGVLISYLLACPARAVLIVPDTRAPWFPVMKSATVRSQSMATKADPNVFSRIHHSGGRVRVVFHKCDIRAVGVNLTLCVRVHHRQGMVSRCFQSEVCRRTK